MVYNNNNNINNNNNNNNNYRGHHQYTLKVEDLAENIIEKFTFWEPFFAFFVCLLLTVYFLKLDLLPSH